MKLKSLLLTSAIILASGSALAAPSIGFDHMIEQDGDKAISNIPPICAVEIIQSGSDELTWNKESEIKFEFRTMNNMSDTTMVTLRGRTEIVKAKGGENANDMIDVKLGGNATYNGTLNDFVDGRSFDIKGTGGTQSIYATLKTNATYDKVRSGNGQRTAMMAEISCD